MDDDENMTTSSSTPSGPQDINDEGFEEDNHYPQDNNLLTNRPHTPVNDHLNAAAPGELSPPRSQPAPTEDITSVQQPPATSETMANGTANRSSARLATQQSRLGAATGAGGDNSGFPPLVGGERDMDKPGWGWKNKKAQEEMQRAWDNIIDRDFSLKEFGDVMMQGKAQMSG